MMALLRNEFAEATILMVGHQPSLEAHFQRKLTLARSDGEVVVSDRRLHHRHPA